MPCVWAVARPIIISYLQDDLQLEAIQDLEASELNELYDILPYEPRAGTTDEEVRDKKHLVSWIMRNLPELKGGRRMETAALVKQSMILRGHRDVATPSTLRASVTPSTSRASVTPSLSRASRSPSTSGAPALASTLRTSPDIALIRQASAPPRSIRTASMPTVFEHSSQAAPQSRSNAETRPSYSQSQLGSAFKELTPPKVRTQVPPPQPPPQARCLTPRRGVRGLVSYVDLEADEFPDDFDEPNFSGSESAGSHHDKHDDAATSPLFIKQEPTDDRSCLEDLQMDDMPSRSRRPLAPPVSCIDGLSHKDSHMDDVPLSRRSPHLLPSVQLTTEQAPSQPQHLEHSADVSTLGPAAPPLQPGACITAELHRGLQTLQTVLSASQQEARPDGNALLAALAEMMGCVWALKKVQGGVLDED